MGLVQLSYAEGQTPLDEEEKEGLLIKSISTHEELNEAEQLNIEDAVQWTIQRRFNPDNILSEEFIRELHKRMFRDVWRWAGEFRKTNKNIGVDKFQIPTDLRILLDDARYWLEHKIYPEDEIAIRLKHRMVSIHCFPNGNGRHSRLFADVVISDIFNRKVFSWGAVNLAKKGDARAAYLKALKAADKTKDVELLLAFARG